jgi:excisionase family DNA binding protein
MTKGESVARRTKQKTRSITQQQKKQQIKNSESNPDVQAAGSWRTPTPPPDRVVQVFPDLRQLKQDDPLLLSIPQVCNLLNLSRSTIDRMAKSESIPGRIKIGGQIRYHRPTLETWLVSKITASCL